MLNRLPKHTPRLGQMLANIGYPSTSEVAQALGVSERTARAWIAADAAPRQAALALYWLTTWGQSSIHAEVVNLMQLHAAKAAAHEAEARELRSQLDRLMACADFGSANAPLFVECTRRASNPVTRSGRASR